MFQFSLAQQNVQRNLCSYFGLALDDPTFAKWYTLSQENKEKITGYLASYNYYEKETELPEGVVGSLIRSLAISSFKAYIKKLNFINDLSDYVPKEPVIRNTLSDILKES